MTQQTLLKENEPSSDHFLWFRGLDGATPLTKEEPWDQSGLWTPLAAALEVNVSIAL